MPAGTSWSPGSSAGSELAAIDTANVAAWCSQKSDLSI
jgi:hypothetical protein